jgi:predicted amino acid racemase
MKLKQQRQDVEYLINAEIHNVHELDEIAERVNNLILMAEEADRLYYRGIYTKISKQVVEDAKVKK